MYRSRITRNIFKGNNILKSLKIASQGILYLFLYHRNMRMIFLLGITALVLGLYFQLKGIELVALCITVTLVFIAEIVNTAIELLMDIISDKYNTKIRLIKDISAAVVILSCLNAVATGYILFIRKIFK